MLFSDDDSPELSPKQGCKRIPTIILPPSEQGCCCFCGGNIINLTEGEGEGELGIVDRTPFKCIAHIVGRNDC